MSRYTDEELKSMATAALAARDAKDIRFVELVMRLSFATRIEPDGCVRRIENLEGEITA